MKTNELFFDLPAELIAQRPVERRGTSRLMVLDRRSGGCEDSSVGALAQHIPRESVIVINNSRVRNARLMVRFAGGKERELILIDRLDANRWSAIGRGLKVGKEGSVERDGTRLQVESAEGPYVKIRFARPFGEHEVSHAGSVPLPPYIRRRPDENDAERYQNVYAEPTGSVAAPTAGLHLTADMLTDLRKAGHQIVSVTLHVGIGTFRPIRSETLEEHLMHEEQTYVSPLAARVVTEAKRAGTPILAVGTTVVRTLESGWSAETGQMRSGLRSTSLYITPGYRFEVVDHLMTNFHTPGSSLIAMVGAFADLSRLKGAYKRAVELRYRFYSYGDAMLIL